jgi:hypothetical protein
LVHPSQLGKDLRGETFQQAGAVLDALVQDFAQQVQDLDHAEISESILDARPLTLGTHQTTLAQYLEVAGGGWLADPQNRR